LLPVSPTAHISRRAASLTALRMLMPVSGLGVGTTCQAVPFQCSARLRTWPSVTSRSKPTAQTLQGPGAVTAPRPFSAAPGLGGGTPVQTSQLAADAVNAPGAVYSADTTKDGAYETRQSRE